MYVLFRGMIFKEGETNYNVDTRIGQNTFLKTPIQVDMGAQGYFFPTKLLKEYCNTKIHSTISVKIYILDMFVG